MARVYLDQATVSSVVYTVYAGGQSYTPSFLSEIGLSKHTCVLASDGSTLLSTLVKLSYRTCTGGVSNNGIKV